MNTFENTERRRTPWQDKVKQIGTAALVGLVIGVGSDEIITHYIVTNISPEIHHISSHNSRKTEKIDK